MVRDSGSSRLRHWRPVDSRRGFLALTTVLLGKGRIRSRSWVVDCLIVLSRDGSRFLKEASAAVDIGKKEPK